MYPNENFANILIELVEGKYGDYEKMKKKIEDLECNVGSITDEEGIIDGLMEK